LRSICSRWFHASGRQAEDHEEYDPPMFPLRWMKYGGLLFLSGVTDMTHLTFEEQFPTIIERITGSLADGGATWNDVKRASFLLHHEESLATLRDGLARQSRRRFRAWIIRSSGRGRASGWRWKLRRR
jgi:hypothetical protein